MIRKNFTLIEIVVALGILAISIGGLLQLKNFDAGPEFGKALSRSALDLLDALGNVGYADRSKILAEIDNNSNNKE